MTISTADTSYAGWIMTTVAGDGEAGYAGDGGPAVEATLNNPFDVVFDAAGNLVFTDTFNHVIRRIDAQSGRIETVAGTGEAGYAGDGGPARNACFNQPYGIAMDRDGPIYVADRLNAAVRRVDGATGMVTNFAGNGQAGFSGDGGPASHAGMVEPNGLAFSSDGSRLYIADVADNRVRVVDMSTGVITTFAGTGEAVHDGDGGPARAAGVFGARAVAPRKSDGGVYILERQGSALRLAASDGGNISTVASTGETGYGGDGGPAAAAIFDRPKEMTLDGAGNALIVDTENHVIRLIDWQADRVNTIAGNGVHGFSGDGVPATQSSLARPHGVAVGPDGSVYIGDTENNRIRKVSRPG
jgi:DNA-binding beta-propeller fold protein YncE